MTRLERPSTTFAILLVAAALLPSTFHLALADRESELAALRARLEKLQSELVETRGDRNEARDRLRNTERQIGKGLQRLRQTNRQIRRESSKLESLAAQRKRLQKDRDVLSNDVGEMIRLSHRLGAHQGLKLLLSQDNPGLASRMLAYYRVLAGAQIHRIDNLRQNLDRLEAVESEIRQRRESLATLRAEQQAEQSGLESVRRERHVVLARLNTEVRNRSQEIAQLKRDRERLGRLLDNLQDTLRNRPLPPETVVQTGKGRWRLPVAGRVVARFGESKRIGDLRWRGVFIAAREGQPVRAVTGGRVVFADWMRGFGLIAVLDHGQGLMTIYGHNESLFKNVGDSVEAGETVATSGNTGGPPQPGLYFEVRQGGKPRNPLDWCKL